MLKKIKKYMFPHLIGFILLCTGWFISIVNTSWDRFAASSQLINGWTITGLVMIVIGAYLPEVWIGIIEKMEDA